MSLFVKGDLVDFRSVNSEHWFTGRVVRRLGSAHYEVDYRGHLEFISIERLSHHDSVRSVGAAA